MQLEVYMHKNVDGLDFSKLTESFLIQFRLLFQAEVLNPDKTPAHGIDVVFDPGQKKGRTAANGIVRVTVNTFQNSQPLVITVSLFTDFHSDVTETCIGGYHRPNTAVLNWRQGPMLQTY